MASISAIAMSAILLAQPSFASDPAQHKAKAKPQAKAAQASADPSENDKIVHVLNRLGYGPRPDDVERVKRMGIWPYIEKQLHPEQIDDSATEQKLQGFTELHQSDADIEARYKDFITMDQSAARMRQQIRKMAAEKTAQMNAQGADAAGAGTAGAATAGQANQQQADQKAMRDMLASDPALQRQMQDTREQLAKVAEPIGLLHEEFAAEKLVRAVDSPRQLQEVLVDFWSNHFNIDIRKAPCGVLKVLDERNVIRPHIFGKFRDLLEASAKSPAMLVYLDNFQSIADQNTIIVPPRRRRGALAQAAPLRAAQAKRKVGLNENYAREIMELHTLGVDGGYSQQDVREVARCFTGWSIGSTDGSRPRINRYGEAGEFRFYPAVHDDGEKMVLGHRIPAGGGMRDGEIVLDILSSSRATMQHVSYQLCQRLVCDEPPAALVSKCVDTWIHTDGDLREVVRTIISSPEFFSPVAMRKKIKSPFEYAVSSVRALDGTLDPASLVPRRQLLREANSMVRPPQGGGYIDINTNTFLGQIGTMGQPIFQYQAPTGFPEDSRKWVSSGALISRLNFSLALTEGRIGDVKLDDPSGITTGTMDAGTMIDRMSNRILHGQISQSTRATLIREAQGEPGSGAALTPAKIAALLLGSPEFQRR